VTQGGIERKSVARQIPLDDGGWWMSLDEGYWQALLEQGEVAPETAPPIDPLADLEMLNTGTEGDLLTDSGSLQEGKGPHLEGDWQIAERAFAQGDLFNLRATGANRGGLLVDWNGLQGFVPASHLNEPPNRQDPQERVSDLSQRIGDSLKLRLIEVDAGQNRLVFSERAATSGTGSPVALLSALRPGDVCRGTVTNLTNFGAFVDLGGVEGLIHISELSWDRVGHPRDVLSVNQDVDVHVLGVNPEQQRIALSLKRLRPNPWTQVESHYTVGEVIEGTVTNVVSFGAFVRVEEGIEGLVHVSELAEGTFLHPRNVVREGDQVQVRVLNIDRANHRLGLSLRQARDGGRPISVEG
jgi:small subunit ribosomal protein S1